MRLRDAPYKQLFQAAAEVNKPEVDLLDIHDLDRDHFAPFRRVAGLPRDPELESISVKAQLNCVRFYTSCAVKLYSLEENKFFFPS